VISTLRLRLLALCFGFVTATLWSADLVPEAPSAVLLDQLTGRVLFQKNPDLTVAPASLTKLMTLHLVWKALADQSLQASDLVPVTAETTGKAVPPGSSLMFLEPGQRVTVRELMLGLAVDSGNDAGMTLAQFLAGSQEAFVGRMNAEAAALGLAHTQFFDAFGYDARNRTTAADFSRFSRLYLAAHPQAVQVLHNVPEMTYPEAVNQAPGDKRRLNPITQQNRNTLIGTYPGADGLKTGFIEESGYNLAATAARNGQRLVAVILGVRGRDTAEGGRLRTAAGARLLDFGFETYPLAPLPLPVLAPIRVWFASPGTVATVPAGPTVYPLSVEERQAIAVRAEGPAEIEGPAALGTVVGRLIWSRAGKDFYTVDVKTTAAAPEAPWWTGLWDRVVLFFRGLTGTPAPKPVSGHTRS
jgi:D-alanyl-D-alanine carboxypeptidase (penicillin-binding protein 5/6)